ncbi:MAG: hypothetical protein L0219_12295 [Phycisphaerales bacterium]|nr:hypothetical protein [Phycisphaerales bacterium]
MAAQRETGALTMNNMDDAETPRLRLYAEDARAIDDLFRQALSKKGATAFSEFCEFIRRFHRFSVFNVMLIRVQRPGAQVVGSRSQWQRIDRWINPDAVPLIILQPFGPVEFVYELGDTAGRPVPGGEYDPFGASGRLDGCNWERAVRAAAKVGIVVEQIEHYGSGLAGTAAIVHQAPNFQSHTEAISEQGGRWRVRVNRALSTAAGTRHSHTNLHTYIAAISGAIQRIDGRTVGANLRTDNENWKPRP